MINDVNVLKKSNISLELIRKLNSGIDRKQRKKNSQLINCLKRV